MRVTLLYCLCLLVLGGCGQKGPLKLPKKETLSYTTTVSTTKTSTCLTIGVVQLNKEENHV